VSLVETQLPRIGLGPQREMGLFVRQTSLRWTNMFLKSMNFILDLNIQNNTLQAYGHFVNPLVHAINQRR